MKDGHIKKEKERLSKRERRFNERERKKRKIRSQSETNRRTENGERIL